MTPFLHLSPQLAFQSLFSFGKILKAFPGTVRIHSTIAGNYPCSRLWYFLRGLDIHGAGVICFDLETVTSIFLHVAPSTIYQWLREGKKLGFFRAYRKDRKSGMMRVFLGGLHSLCLNLGLNDWGKVATVSTSDILGFFGLRCHAAAAATTALQHGSRFAAKSKLKKGSGLRVLHPHEIFNWENEHTCQKSGKRVKVPYLVYVSKRIAFVRQSFVPFGICQDFVAGELGRSSRTVRRYLDYLKIPRRQICQRDSKFESALNYVRFLDSESLRADAQVILEENRSGRSVQLKIGSSRLFQYWGHTWLRRCNIYDLHYRLNTMKAARNELGKLIKRKIAPAEIAARCSTEGSISRAYKSVVNLENSPECTGDSGNFQKPG